MENKKASGFDRVNPRTGKPAQTEADWARKHVSTTTGKRIDALAKAVGTRPTSHGSTKVPGLAEVQGIRHIHFKVDGSTPALRAAVHAELANLRAQHPDWTFTAEFGIDAAVRPVPRADEDEHESDGAQ